MKRSNKTYLTLLGIAASIYFIGAVILKGHEARAMKELADQSSNVSVSGWYYAFAALFGILAGILVVYYFISRKNEISIQDLLKSKGDQWKVSFGGIGGLAFGLICSFGLIGNLPKIQMPKIDISNNVAMADQNQSDDQKQQEETTAHKFPIPPLPDVLPTDNNVDIATGALVISKEEDASGTLNADQSDQSALLVSDGGSASVVSSTIQKTGAQSAPDVGSLYGVNSAVLIKAGGLLNMMGSNITTVDTGAPGLSVNGKDASATITDSRIQTQGASSAGLQSMYAGSLNATTVQVITSGENSPALNVRNGSAMVIQNPTIQTSANGSPIMQNTGTMNLYNLNANASNAYVGLLNMGSTTEIRSSTISAAGATDQAPSGSMFILPAAEDDSAKQPAKLLISGSTVGINPGSAYPGAPLITTNGADFDITLESSSLNLPSNVLINQNGGSGTLTLNAQQISGTVNNLDGSKMNLNITGQSSLIGAINAWHSNAEINVKLSADSRLTLIADCYVTSFENEDATNSNINYNGHQIYAASAQNQN